MENQETSVEIFEKIKWNIENFSHLHAKNIYSEPFVLGGYPWRIVLYPKGNNVDDSLSIYLEVMPTANMSEEWTRDVKFKLVFNQVNTNMTIKKESNNEFNASHKNWGFSSFMPLDELHNLEKGFIVKDTCIVGAEVFVCKSANENQVNQAAKITVSITSRSQISHNKEVEIPSQEASLVTCSPVSTMVCIEPTKPTDEELFSPSIGEVMDFSSLEHQGEICSPSFNEPPPMRSRRFGD